MEDQTRVGATTESRSLVGPFPWGSLERVSRAEASDLRDIRQWMATTAPLEAWAAAAGDLVGVKVSVRLERATAATPSGIEGALAVLVLGAAGSAARHGVRIEVEPALAATVLARALGRRTPRALDPAWSAPQSIAGAFAAILVATARRAGHGDALVVRSAGLAGSTVRASVDGPSGITGDGGTGWIAASLTVLIEDEAFAARVMVPRDALRSTGVQWGARVLAALGPTPLAIPIVACVVGCERAELAALAPGDIFLPSSWPVARAAGGLSGPVTLAAPGAATGVRALFGDDGRLVLSGEIEPFFTAEADMSDAEETAGILSAIGDVPVVVRVEIGEARMSAREWASLRPGDVVTVGRKVGEQVVLRVGGVPVARGQLVEVDGEVGVRIEERVVEERTTA
jgi:flagellar motor switch/type III secretory pathway protein FliN